MVFADLHIHGRYSRACSKNLDFDNLNTYAKIKGLNLLGTGDFTHELWIKDLEKYGVENEIVLGKANGDVKFVYQTEVSLIYSQDSKARRIHLVMLSPASKVKEINEFLSKKGNLKSDGRPIFGKYTCAEFVEDMRAIDDKIEIIPAHVWTPWFGLFGSKSGFDSLNEAFQDQSKYINAIETGLSSDPLMNWRIKELQDKAIISSSDSHSFWPWRIGREATDFKLKNEFSYDDLIRAIRHKKINKTIEVDPAYGKYHYDGHRMCQVSMSPRDAKRYNYICPKCNKEMTLGVLHRVEELADYDDDVVKSMDFEAKKDYKTVLPLAELISNSVGKALNTKTVKEKYFKLVNKYENEFNILFNVPLDDLKREINDSVLIDLLSLNRKSEVPVIPGYDGVYGKIDMVKVKELVKGSLMKYF